MAEKGSNTAKVEGATKVETQPRPTTGVTAMAASGNDAKFFTRGKIQEFKQELQEADRGKDKKFVKRKTVLKKIVANITMGNDSAYYLLGLSISSQHNNEILMRHRDLVSQMFSEVIQCLPIPVLEIKKSELHAPVSSPSPWAACCCSVHTDYSDIRSPTLCSGLPLPGQLRTCKTRPNRKMYPAF